VTVETLTYIDYCNYFAKKCNKCNGSKKVLVYHGDDHVGTWNACGCQFIASTKWRYDQIPLSLNLKNKTWKDFEGIVPEGGTSIDLDGDTFAEAKSNALEYCFGSSNPSVIQDRAKSLVIHTRTNNMVISGGQRTGKTLLVALILKEVVYASVLNGISLVFRYIKNSELLEKSRWDNNKPVDHDFLTDITDLNFLVIDGVNDPAGHTTPPDLICLDRLFSNRHLAGRPTIFICSDIFKAKLFSDNKYERDAIIKKFGEEYYSALTDTDNVFIDLRRG